MPASSGDFHDLESPRRSSGRIKMKVIIGLSIISFFTYDSFLHRQKKRTNGELGTSELQRLGEYNFQLEKGMKSHFEDLQIRSKKTKKNSLSKSSKNPALKRHYRLRLTQRFLLSTVKVKIWQILIIYKANGNL